MVNMKETNIDWIGKIPIGWSLAKFKNFSNNGMGQTILKEDLIDSGIPVYSATRSSKIFGYVNDSTVKLTKGDFVIPARGNSIGNVTLIEDDVATCTQTTIYSVINGIDKKYLYYLSNAFKDIWFYYDNTAIPQITVTQVKENLVLVPPEKEQKQIVKFLDKKTFEIDKILSETKNSIKEYKKYKQSIITEIVTEGINSNVETRGCKIYNLEQIPKSWQEKKLKYIMNLGTGKSITKKDFSEEGTKLLNYGDIHSKYKFDVDVERDILNNIPGKFVNENDNSIVKNGDFVFCDTSEDIEGCGNNALIKNDGNNILIAGSHTIIGRLKIKMYPKYVRYLLDAAPIRAQIRSVVSGVKVLSITQKILGNISLLIPTYQEQEEISWFLDKKIEEINNLIDNKEKMVKELEKYKKSLIYEVVTGKKEV